MAQIKDLPGCLTQRETLEEAIANINEARQLWMETVYEAGDEIPYFSKREIYSRLNKFICFWYVVLPKLLSIPFHQQETARI